MSNLEASGPVAAGGVFLGRERELHALHAGLGDALSGHGRLFFLIGEPGIGKTRLADEIAREAAARGMGVLWGRCWEGGGAPAYWPWVQVIRRYAEDVGVEAVASILGSGAADIAQIVPEVSPSPAAVPPDLDVEQARFRLFDSTTLFLKRAADVRPLLIVLDDLHAADLPSMLLLQFLSRELRRTRILVLGTYRDVEVRRSPARATALGELGRESQRLMLTGLSADGVKELIEHTFHLTFPPQVIAAVHQTTDGNPFFVDEVARLLVAEGRWQQLEGDSADIKVPDGVRDAIRCRLEPLGDDARRILAIGAVIGREFDLNVLARVVAADALSVLDALGEAIAMDIIRETRTRVGRYTFAHTLIRDTLRYDLPPARRMQLHREVGDAIESLPNGQGDPNFAELAHHFFHAAATGGADKAIVYATRAGDQALQQLAYEEAASHYARALEALKFKEPDEALRCELLLALGEAQRRAADAPAANETFQRAARIAQKLGAAPQLARAALGFGRGGEIGVVNEILVGLLEDALERLGTQASELRALAMGRLAMALYFSPDQERRAQLSAQAVAMARQLGSRAPLVATLVARHFAIWGPDTLGDRLAVAEEIVAASHAIGEREMGMEGRLWRLVDLLESGDVANFQREWESFARLAGDLRLPVYRWHAEMIRATWALADGRLEEAERISQQALRAGEDACIPRAAQFFGVQLFMLRRQQGRLAELEGAVRTFADQYPALPIWRCGLALLYAVLDRAVEARREIERLGDAGFAALPRDGNWLPAVAMLGEACAALADAPHAERLYELMAPHAGHNVVISEVIAYLGPVSYFLALLATTLQRWNEAALHFEAAIETAAGLGATMLAAQAEAGYARMLLARNAAGDPAHAANLIDRAAWTFQQRGMVERAECVRALQPEERQARAGTPPATLTAERQRTSATFRKDGDFWTVVFEGTVLRLKDSRGLFYLAYLLRHPGREFHAMDLVAAAQGGVDPAELSARAGVVTPELERRSRRQTDGEPILDAQAKAAYRRRLVDLKEELDEAQQFNDLGRIERAQQEIDLITRELSAAVGLGGRDRTISSDSERSRVAVTKAIALVLKSIAEGNPALRRYFKYTIKTGRFCSYAPDEQSPINWSV